MFRTIKFETTQGKEKKNKRLQLKHLLKQNSKIYRLQINLVKEEKIKSRNSKFC